MDYVFIVIKEEVEVGYQEFKKTEIISCFSTLEGAEKEVESLKSFHPQYALSTSPSFRIKKQKIQWDAPYFSAGMDSINLWKPQRLEKIFVFIAW